MTDYPTYSAGSLERVLHSLERRYSMSSDDFMAARAAEMGRLPSERLEHIPNFTRHACASFYTEWQELTASGDDFAERVEHELALS